MPQNQNELFEKIKQLSEDDQNKLLMVIEVSTKREQSLFKSIPNHQFSIPFPEDVSDFFAARYNLRQAESIFWVLGQFTRSHGLGFDSFNNAEAFENISYLCEIGLSAIESCDNRTHFLETELRKIKKEES